MDRTLKWSSIHSAVVWNSTLLWCCLFLNSTQFVILDNLSVLDLALSGAKGLNVSGNKTAENNDLVESKTFGKTNCNFICDG